MDFSVIALVILAVSICVKLYMCLYNRRIGKKIRSAAMEAVIAAYEKTMEMQKK